MSIHMQILSFTTGQHRPSSTFTTGSIELTCTSSNRNIYEQITGNQFNYYTTKILQQELAHAVCKYQLHRHDFWLTEDKANI